MDAKLEKLNSGLTASENKLKEEMKAMRSGRPSVEAIADIQLNFYNDTMTIQQLGSISMVPPRQINITAWDKNAVGAISKAIEDAKIGFSASADGMVIRATLPQLSDERRAELEKTIKKMVEAVRIQVRNHRDEAMKEFKKMEEEKAINEDQLFKLKEEAQKLVDGVNGRLEKMLEDKIKELHE